MLQSSLKLTSDFLTVYTLLCSLLCPINCVYMGNHVLPSEFRKIGSMPELFLYILAYTEFVCNQNEYNQMEKKDKCRIIHMNKISKFYRNTESITGPCWVILEPEAKGVFWCPLHFALKMDALLAWSQFQSWKYS